MKKVYINDQTKKLYIITKDEFQNRFLISDLNKDNIYIHTKFDFYGIVNRLKLMFVKQLTPEDRLKTFLILQEFAGTHNYPKENLEYLHRNWSGQSDHPLSSKNDSYYYSQLDSEFKTYLDEYILMEYQEAFELLESEYSNVEHENLEYFFKMMNNQINKFIYRYIKEYADNDYVYLFGYITDSKLLDSYQQYLTDEQLQKIVYDQWYTIATSNSDGDIIDPIESISESDIEIDFDDIMKTKYNARPAKIKYL